MRLGIDLDGVVADFNNGWIERYNSEFGAVVSIDEVDAWGVIPALTHFRHMGEFWRWASDMEGASLFRHLDPYPEALPALGRLSSRHHIVIITTKPAFAIHDTFEWIAEHRLPTREVHVTPRKWEVECDVYLDDGPHNLDELVQQRPSALICRYARPWNHPIDGTLSVDGWDEFEEVVASI